MGELNRITFIFHIFLVLLFLGPSTVFGATLVVDASGGGNYTTIQDAINAATTVDGDTVLVRDGTYTENITVSKRLAIMSEHGNVTTTVVAADPNTHVFTISANSVTIKGFSIYGATGGRAGIYINGDASNSTLTENRCGYDTTHMNYFGIYLRTTGHVVSNNYCSGNTQGILLDGVSDSSMMGNTCTGNAVNIKVAYSGPNNTVSGNHVGNGNIGIWIADSDQNVIIDNTIEVNGNGIQLTNANDNIVSRNMCLDNGYGLNLSTSSNNLLSENTCTEGSYGIYLYGGGTNHVFDNIFSNNDRGVQLNASNTNVFRGNTISSNNYGMWGATSNTVYLNNFIDNLYCAYTNDDSAHTRYSPTPIRYVYNGTSYTSYLGNYYSDHNLADSDGNGVTDNPYRVLSSFYARLIVDQYPLSSTTDHYLDLNESPKLIIITPADGSTLSQDNGPVPLTAQAYDFDDGDISGTTTWASSLDGTITSPAGLSAGIHTVTASITDSGGLTVTASVTITVTPRTNTPPTVTITSPANGATFPVDAGPIPFAGIAADPEEGDISATIRWSSNIDGAFTSPAALSVGTHAITASATDSGGLTGSASMTVTITPHVNRAPVVTITYPADGSTFSQDNGAINLAAQADDFEDGNISSAIVWSSSLSGVITSPAILSAGTHILTARVTDSGGLSGSASITLTITPHINVAPTIHITAPANNSTFSDAAGPITFTATANDLEDGDLSGYIQWSSSINGTFTSPVTLSVGIHTISASVTDSGGLSGTDLVTVQVTPSTPLMHVAEMDVIRQYVGSNRYSGRARIRIVDGNGAPVANAMVWGTWSGSASDSDSVLTGSDGWAAAYSDRIRRGTTFTFCVTDVAKPGWAYDPARNVETCDSN